MDLRDQEVNPTFTLVFKTSIFLIFEKTDNFFSRSTNRGSDPFQSTIKTLFVEAFCAADQGRI